MSQEQIDQAELANAGNEPTQRDAHENEIARRVLRSAFEKLGKQPDEEVLSTFVTAMQSAIHDLNHPILMLEPGPGHFLFLRIDRPMPKDERNKAWGTVKGLFPNNRVILVPDQYDIHTRMGEVIGLLHSMVACGEKHTDESRSLVEQTLAFLQT